MSRIFVTKQATSKKLMSCLLIVLCLSILMLNSACNSSNNSGNSGNNGNGQEIDLEMWKIQSFLDGFYFDCNHDLERGDSLSNYSDFVLVIDESEQVNYPEDAIVAWPTIYTERILWSVNYFALYDSGADPTPYGLTYPITMTDVIENWESFYDFVFDLDESERHIMMSPWYGYAESDEGWKPLPEVNSTSS